MTGLAGRERRRRRTMSSVSHEASVHRCQLCGRIVPSRLITRHHTLPKQKGGRAEHRVPMCKPCHKQVHATFDNSTLCREYASIELLRSAEPLQPYLRWIRRQAPDRNFMVRMSASHPGDKRRRLAERRRRR